MMKSKLQFFALGVILIFTTNSCNVQNIEKYNEEFKGEWRTGVYFSPTKGDSIRNFLTIDGADSGFGIACDKDDPFEKCLRSEEHTSELQSRPHLVCRLLLEK